MVQFLAITESYRKKETGLGDSPFQRGILIQNMVIIQNPINMLTQERKDLLQENDWSMKTQ